MYYRWIFPCRRCKVALGCTLWYGVCLRAAQFDLNIGINENTNPLFMNNISAMILNLIPAKRSCKTVPDGHHYTHTTVYVLSSFGKQHAWIINYISSKSVFSLMTLPQARRQEGKVTHNDQVRQSHEQRWGVILISCLPAGSVWDKPNVQKASTRSFINISFMLSESTFYSEVKEAEME